MWQPQGLGVVVVVRMTGGIANSLNSLLYSLVDGFLLVQFTFP